MSTEQPVVKVRMVYAGRRWNGPKIVHAWFREADLPQPDDGPGRKELWFDKLPGIAIGGVYEVDATDDTATRTFAKSARWVEDRAGITDELLDEWRVQDIAVHELHQHQRAEKAAAKRTAHEKPLQELEELAAKLRTRHDVEAFAQLVAGRIRQAGYARRR